MITYSSKSCLIALILVFSSCWSEPNQIDKMHSYLAWINDEANGLVKTRYINGIKLSLKYLSPEYLVYKDFPDITSTSSLKKNDSLIKAFANSLSFMLSIGPDERDEDGVDITHRKISNYKEYAERIHTLNFDMENYFLLKTEDNEFMPVLSSMENTYELTKGRNIILVFAPHTEDQTTDFYSSGELDIVYHDELFDTGTSHFVFDRAEISKASQIFSIQNQISL